MSEPFDPTIALAPQGDAFPGGPSAPQEPSTGLTTMLAQQRHAFSGMDDLPVDEPELPGQETEQLPGNEPPPPASAVVLPIDPGVIPDATPSLTPQSTPEMAALQAQLALVTAQLAAMQAQQQPATRALPVAPPALSDEVRSRIASRWDQTFSQIEQQNADEDDAAYRQRRADAFTQTILQSVIDDLLPTEAFQARLRPAIEQIATTRAQQVSQDFRQSMTIEQQQATLVQDAVTAARTAGYDVYVPTDPRHQQSRESKLFWGAAQMVDQALPGGEQIRETLALLPPKTPVTAAPATPPQTRPQPMARSGTGPVPTTGNQPEGEYQPMTLHGAMQRAAEVRRVA